MRLELYYLDAREYIGDRELCDMLILNIPVTLAERCLSAGNDTLRAERAFAYSLLMHAIKKRGINTEKCNLLFTEHGKMYLKDGECRFSISHDKGFVAVCVCDCEVGVDIQAVDEDRAGTVKRLCKRFFDGVSVNSARLGPDFLADKNLTPSFFEVCFDTVRASFVERRAVFTKGADNSPYKKWCECEALVKLSGTGICARGDMSELVSSATVATSAVLLEFGEVAFLSVAIYNDLR